MFLLKEKRIKLFFAISALIIFNVFFTLCVSAAGFIEEINCPGGTIYLSVGEEYNLAEKVSVYPNDDGLKENLNYYTKNTSVVSLNNNNGCVITAKNYGRADIIISSLGCTEIVTVYVIHPLFGGEIEFDSKTIDVWDELERELNLYSNTANKLNCYMYALAVAERVEENAVIDFSLYNAGEVGGFSGTAYQEVDKNNFYNFIIAMAGDVKYCSNGNESVTLIDVNNDLRYNWGITDSNNINGDRYKFEDGLYRVALFYDSSRQGAMHWMRQNADGTWSHKLGYSSPVSNLDAKGNIIFSPLTCDMSYRNYDKGDYNYEYVATILIRAVK